MEKNKVLIVDDDTNIAGLISLYLTKECFQCEIANDGETALNKLREFHPDLILLDIMLPGIDGYEVCRIVRKHYSTPIIMLSAKGEVFDKVLGLEMGADDYIIKPFDSKEMVARVKAVLRRYTNSSELSSSITPNNENETVCYTDLVVSLSNFFVLYKGDLVKMPPKELELLYFLASHPNHVFTREQLLDHVWGFEFLGETRTVDAHIRRLRSKIPDHKEWAIKTVWRIGYKFETGGVS